jgi:hypothetical protein
MLITNDSAFYKKSRPRRTSSLLLSFNVRSSILGPFLDTVTMARAWNHTTSHISTLRVSYCLHERNTWHQSNHCKGSPAILFSPQVALLLISEYYYNHALGRNKERSTMVGRAFRHRLCYYGTCYNQTEIQYGKPLFHECLAI